jgi:hypothetical protein
MGRALKRNNRGLKKEQETKDEFRKRFIREDPLY